MDFEVMMFKDDAIVEGSRMILTDPTVTRMRTLQDYASKHGYTFSCKEVIKKN